MLTPREIQDVEFTKVLGGYKANEVDEFIDKCTDTVTALNREKDELKKKLEVLADKLVEYRQEEDNIRTALLSAQKMGDTVVREANHKASLILEDAQIKADNVLENAKKQIVDEEQELARVKAEVSNFKARLLSIYREHLTLINVLDAEDENEDDKSEQSAENADAEPTEETPQETAETEAPAEEAPDEAEDEAPAAEADEDAQKDAPETEEPEREIPSRFANLKFGEDYDIAAEAGEDSHSGLFKRNK